MAKTTPFFLFTILIFVLTESPSCQNIGINSTGNAPNSKALLDLDQPGKGLLIPRMDSTDRPTSSVPESLLIYQNDNDPGYYYYNGSKWVPLLTSAAGGGAAGWALKGNSGTQTPGNFLGTTDAMGLSIRTNDTERMRIADDGDIGLAINDSSNITNKLEVADSVLFRRSGSVSGTGKKIGDIATVRAKYQSNSLVSSGYYMASLSGLTRSSRNVGSSSILMGIKGKAAVNGTSNLGSSGEVIGTHGEAIVTDGAGSSSQVIGLRGIADLQGTAENGSIIAGVYGKGTGDSSYAGYFPEGNIYMRDSLGIGTDTPRADLDVFGAANIDSMLTIGPAPNNTAEGGEVTLEKADDGSKDGHLDNYTWTGGNVSGIRLFPGDKMKNGIIITDGKYQDIGNFGVGKNQPESTLDVGGSRGYKAKTVSSDYTAGDESIILGDASGGAITITLPPVADVNHRVYNIKKIDGSGNNVVIDANSSETIDGSTTHPLSSQYDAVEIVAEGAWYVISKNP